MDFTQGHGTFKSLLDQYYLEATLKVDPPFDFIIMWKIVQCSMYVMSHVL